MSERGSNRGVSRVLAKLETSIAEGNYYEAHQIYRTLYFRLVGQKKFDECLDLLYKGALTFLNREQFSSGADLALLVIDTLEKSEVEDFQIWFQRLGVLLSKMNVNVVERETVLLRAVKWSADVSKNNLGHPIMHKLIAQLMWAEGSIEQARHHYLLSRDGTSCGQMLVQLSQNKGFASETDLFIAQVILQQLTLKETKTATKTFETYTKYHPKIASSEPPFIMPLLNFIFFLLKSIETGKLAMFKSLCDLYKASLDRDPSYEKYLQKIGVIFFGASPPQQPGMGGLFGDLFNRLFQGIEEDEGESQPQETSRPNRSSRNPNATPSELD